MEENKDLQIVKVTNISNKNFTADSGARFNGRDYSIPAGKSLRCPQTLGEHLAKHLARMIFMQNAEISGKQNELAIWSEEDEKNLINKIISFEEMEESIQHKTADDILKEKVMQLNQDVGEEVLEINDKNGNVVYNDKAEIIAELEKRGITFNPRSSKSVLEELLKNDE